MAAAERAKEVVQNAAGNSVQNELILGTIFRGEIVIIFRYLTDPIERNALSGKACAALDTANANYLHDRSQRVVNTFWDSAVILPRKVLRTQPSGFHICVLPSLSPLRSSLMPVKRQKSSHLTPFPI